MVPQFQRSAFARRVLKPSSLVLLLLAACALGGALRLLSVHASEPIGQADKASKASSDGIWQQASVQGTGKASVAIPAARGLRLNAANLTRILSRAPMEFTAEARETTTMIDLPMPDGSFVRFRIVESPISAVAKTRQPDAGQQIEFQSYSGQAIDDPTVTMRLSWAANGLHAIILSASGAFFIEPATAGDTVNHIAYAMKDAPDAGTFSCGVSETARVAVTKSPTISQQGQQQTISNGAELRVFRTAVAATAMYVQQNGGTAAAALVTLKSSINAVNAIMERELSLRLQLIPDADELRIFSSNVSDYTDSDTDKMLTENQQRLPQILGASAYDVGHVLGVTGAFSGVAQLGSACGNEKARGSSTLAANQPTRPAWVIGIAHEFAHQFNAPHTFNGTGGACGNQRDGVVAYEPGSGSTIMCYPGSCDADNLQRNNDPYFHTNSLERITAHAAANGTCGTRMATGNNPPTVNAGAAFTIPGSTPFSLTGSGSDPDGDTVTYTWEQYNLGPQAPPNTDDGQRPIFRSYNPTTSPTRIFPAPQYIASHGNTPPLTYSLPQTVAPDGTVNPGGNYVVGELLPTTNRTMVFRLTARDGRAQGGFAIASTQVTVNTAGGAFEVTAPANNAEFLPGAQTSVTWNVSGTNAAPFNVANVRITLSSDGGLTFPTELAASVPNNGTATVTLPNNANGKTRVRVEAIGNIFFSVSGLFFVRQPCNALTLSPETLPDAGHYLNYSPVTLTTTNGTAPITFAIAAGGTLPENVTLSAAGVLSGVPQNAGTFNFTVVVTDAVGCTVQRTYTLRVLPSANAGDAGGKVPVANSLRAGALAARRVAGVPINVPVTLSQAFSAPVTLNYTTVDGTAHAGVNYQVASGTLTFMPGETAKMITVMATNATAGPPVDKFKVVLSAPGNAIINDGESEVDLIEDDTAGCAPFTLNPTTLPPGKIGVAYTPQTITGSGNITPLFHYAIVGGALPEGLDLDEDTGVISGTPQQSGTFNVELAALDNNYCDGERVYTLVISPGAPVINTFTPAQAARNTSVVIRGTGFTGATSVKFGGVAAASFAANRAATVSFVVNSDNQITATTPTSFPTGVVSVTTPNGTGQSTQQLAFINDLPVANAASFVTNRNSTVSGKLTGSDANGDALAFNLPSGESRAGGNGSVSLNFSTGDFTFTPNAGFVGTAQFFFRVSDGHGESEMAKVTVIVADNGLSASLSDPVVCTGPGGVVTVTAQLTNNNAFAQPVSFNATLPATLLALPGTCTTSAGNCTIVNPSTVTVTATLVGNQTATISYKAQISDAVAPATQLCVNSTASFNGAPPLAVTVCNLINCPAVGPGLPYGVTSPLSDQKAGSVLIYNIYTSGSDPIRQNTRLSITNTDSARQAYVHLFFVDGTSCSVADSYLCLTPNQTTSFLASDLDPGTTGYLVAVATDAQGCPINFNFLIGDEYVKFQSGHAANLAAQSVSAIAGGQPFCNANASTAALAFDGVSYNVLPRTLAASNLPSRADGNDTMLILNRIGGNLGLGASSLGTIFGLLYDDTESGLSFSITGGCQYRNSVSGTTIRTAPRFEQFVPAGRSSWIKLSSQSDIGVTGALINFNPNATTNAGAFNQGHNLHSLTNSSSAFYIIPVFPPSC